MRSSCNMSLSFAAVESIWIVPSSTFIRDSPLTSRVESGWNRPEPDNCSLFRLQCSAHLQQQRLIRISYIGTFLIERNANHSSAFSFVEPNYCRGTSTSNRSLCRSTVPLGWDNNNQPKVSTLYRSARMEQQRLVPFLSQHIALLGTKSNDSCGLPSAKKK